mmetsp:Transcript_69311/g.166181  ORF Transcript_69311/g.166181 Transcript_69311/m.166181 type:complete len:301 (-) Transcript_69311:78-980(-)
MPSGQDAFKWPWQSEEKKKEYSKAIERLRSDWLSDNSDAREEMVTRKILEERIAAAEKAASDAGLRDPGKLLDVAEAYGVLDPCDKKCFEATEVAIRCALPFLNRQRQGDAHQLHGRCLFMAERYEESLQALLRAHACFKEMGNRHLRRINNVGLLRAYAALGRGKEAAERLEVAFTMCEGKDDPVFLYMSGKGALEETDCARDAEVFDDIWYVYLDTHPEAKQLFEQYDAMGQGVCKTLPRDERDGEFESFDEVRARLYSQMQEYPHYTFLAVSAVVVYIVLACWLVRNVYARAYSSES